MISYPSNQQGLNQPWLGRFAVQRLDNSLWQEPADLWNIKKMTESQAMIGYDTGWWFEPL